jgi:xanthine/CO dehydrogenase XdhC/CoxF family maturation factor
MGGVSGGCLEADVREVALGVMRSGTPRLLHYETGADESTVWGLGLGCNGAVDIFVQSIGVPAVRDVLPAFAAAMAHDEAIAACTLVSGPAVGCSLLATAERAVAGSTGRPDLDREIAHLAATRLAGGESRLDPLGADQVFIDVLLPPPHLLVCGAGDDARPLVQYAAEAGFRVTVVDHRPAYLSADRFPLARQLLLLRPEESGHRLVVSRETSVVIMTHSLPYDREWLRCFLASDAEYIGLLGPRARAAGIMGQLGVEADRRVFGPVGLDLGADGPEQIGISIVAELLAVRAGRQGQHLRERPGAIHVL